MHSDDDNGRLAALPFALARNALIKRRELTAAPCVSRVLAAFVDVSGYTRFADEIISRHKDRGLGQLVDELERLLVPAATAALRHDGNIVAIEGDALLVTFDEADDLVRFCRDLQPLRETVARTPDGAAHRLRLDIGVSHGRLYEFVAGDDDGRVYIASGSALRGAHAMEQLARDGRIVLSFPLRGSVQHGSHYTIRAEDLPRLEPQRRPRDPVRRVLGSGSPAAAGSATDDDAYVASFHSSAPRRVRSQLLCPVIAFSDLPLIRMAFARVAPRDGSRPEPRLARDALTELYLGLRDIVETRAEGYIAKLKDENALFLFGAPRLAEDAPIRAFEAMAAVQDLHVRLCRRHGLRRRSIVTGMHRGDALCGPVLGHYDAIGSSVNLAARIKDSGLIDVEGEDAERQAAELRGRRRRIRFTREMLDDERVARLVKGYQVDRRHLRGLEDTITICFDLSSITGLGTTEDAFVLRQQELDQLVVRVQQCLGSPGGGQVVNVIGEVGSGKDRLLAQLAAEVGRDHRTCGVRCSAGHRDDPYRTLLELLKSVCRAGSDGELFQRAIGHQPRNERDLNEALSYFAGHLLRIPAVLIINNGENIDRESADFFDELAPRLVAAGCFVAYSGTARLFTSGEDVVLDDLDAERAAGFARKVAATLLPAAELTAAQLDEIVRASAGNPLYIAELVKSMKADAAGQLCFGDAPSNLRDAVLKQVQQALAPSPLLQAALERYSLLHSVALMAPLVDDEAETNLGALRTMGYLSEEHEFASDVLRRVVAASIDPRRRQRLCSELARAAEAAGLADHLAIFAYLAHGELTDHEQRRALYHAARHLDDTGHLARARDDLFDQIASVANLGDAEQRRTCGALLLRKALSLLAGCSDREMQRAHALARRASALVRGTSDEARALAAMAASACRPASDPSAAAAPARREALAESQRLFESARETALRCGDAATYLEVSCQLAETLLDHQPAGVDPLVASLALEETERRLQQLPALEPGPEVALLSARFDRVLADTLARAGEHDRALWNCALALDKARRAGWTAEVIGCEAIRAEVLTRRGDPAAAGRLARTALQQADAAGLSRQAPEVRRLTALLRAAAAE